MALKENPRDAYFLSTNASLSSEDQLKLQIQWNSRTGLYMFLALSYPVYLLRDFLPSWLFILLVAVVARRVWRFERWHHEIPHLGRFLACFLVMLAELLMENFLVWTVSATDERKFLKQWALQDNVEGIIKWVDTNWFPWTDWFIQLPLGETLLFLFAAIALAFSAGWHQMSFSGLGIMSRYFLCTALCRTIRTASFLSTVVPSPRPGCFSTRFPRPPEDWYNWIKVGVLAMRGTGGCNDLVFSGHAVTWFLTILLFQTYHRPLRFRRLFMGIMWFLMVHTSLRDVVNKQHYSVDMFLAVVVSKACWQWTEWIYPPQKYFLGDVQSEARLTANNNNKRSKPPKEALIMIVLSVIFAWMLVYIAKA